MHTAPRMGRLGIAFGLLAAAARTVSRAPAQVVTVAASDGGASLAWVDIKNDTTRSGIILRRGSGASLPGLIGR